MPSEKWSLLLVDDEPLVVQLVAARLKSQGYGVLTAPNGQEADALLQKNKFHLVLCDAVMPVLDGPGLCRRVRARGDATPFLFLTAKGLPHDIVEVLSAGADDYLVKPFDAGELLARIKAILRRIYPS
ncbi:MAG: hypothetical protein A2992_01770 [Elusimicrobia bacterium RIFCSPLOWO2_01_FULL_59_12]|nr:MAG: hypothetical protein A2992_01770 [Elusimicrobia bacterium RIFCSPLOWO2_01_FULL_59_12]